MLLLLLKAWRDLRANRVGFLACASMIGLGVALFVAFTSSVLDLERSCDLTYQRLRFLDFMFEVRDGTPALVERLRRLPGVEAAEGRRATAVRVILKAGPGDLAEATARVKGVALGLTPGQHPSVNDLYLDEGRYLQAGHGEALLERRFARVHGFVPGDELRLLWRENISRYTVVGLVSSPEYLWLASDRLDPQSVARKFGVVFISHTDMANMVGTSGFNEIHVRVSDPARRQALMEEAKRTLGSAAPERPVPREEQASNSLLIRDRRAFAGVAIFFPVVFLSLSAIILISTLWQLVAQQRRVIGVLMAQGVSPVQLVLHYLAMCLAVGLGGAGVGALGGHFLGEMCTNFYAQNLGIPFVLPSVHSGVIALVVAGAAALSLAAGFLAVFRILDLQPTQALRPEFAPVGRLPSWERWVPLMSRLPYRLRVPLRNLQRQPIRTWATVLGIAFAVMQILMTVALFDSQKDTLDYYFREVHTYDLHVALQDPVSPRALPPVESWPGVSRVERCLSRGGRFNHGTRHMERRLWGIPAGGRLLRLYDSQRRPIRVDAEGPLWLGPLLANRLQTAPGDTVSVQVGDPEAIWWNYLVGPQLYEPLGNPAKLPLDRLQRQAAACADVPRDAVNVLLISVEPGYLATVTRRLFELKCVRDVNDMAQMQEDVHDMLRMFEAYRALMFGFSGLLAVALLLGTTTLNVQERGRELATLSTLGVRDRDIALLLLTETLIIWLIGLVLGVPGGYLLGNWLLNHYQSDLIQLDMALHTSSVLYTAVITLGITIPAVLQSLRRVLHLPLQLAQSLE